MPLFKKIRRFSRDNSYRKVKSITLTNGLDQMLRSFLHIETNKYKKASWAKRKFNVLFIVWFKETKMVNLLYLA